MEFEGEGPFMFPLCEAKAGILMGEDVGIIILKTVEGDRFGVPLGYEALRPSIRFWVRLFVG